MRLLVFLSCQAAAKQHSQSKQSNAANKQWSNKALRNPHARRPGSAVAGNDCQAGQDQQPFPGPGHPGRPDPPLRPPQFSRRGPTLQRLPAPWKAGRALRVAHSASPDPSRLLGPPIPSHPPRLASPIPSRPILHPRRRRHAPGRIRAPGPGQEGAPATRLPPSPAAATQPPAVPAPRGPVPAVASESRDHYSRPGLHAAVRSNSGGRCRRLGGRDPPGRKSVWEPEARRGPRPDPAGRLAR